MDPLGPLAVYPTDTVTRFACPSLHLQIVQCPPVLVVGIDARHPGTFGSLVHDLADTALGLCAGQIFWPETHQVAPR